MKILITGASGFIGQCTLKMLQNRGHELVLLVRNVVKAIHLKNPDTFFVEGDLGNLCAVKESIRKFAPEACLHLAWEGIPDFSAENCKQNLYYSIELIDFLCRETNCKKIIVSGTCAEYGKTQGECVETEQESAASFFAWAKRALFNYASLLCAQSSIDLVWFRLFYVYGPGQRAGSLIPSLAQSFRDGKNPSIRNPFNANDYIHIEDVAEAMLLALEKTVESGIYNLGSGQATSVLDVCGVVEEEISGTAGFKQSLELSKVREYMCFWANTEKVKRALGWEPKHELRQGIRLYLQATR